MKSSSTRTLVAAAGLFAFIHPATAVTLAGNRTSPGAASVVAPAVIERGGAVTAIDAGSRTLSVDGVVYLFSTGAAIVHGDPAATASAGGQLQKGALIRFNTEPSRSGGREVIKELWIVRPAGPTPNGR